MGQVKTALKTGFENSYYVCCYLIYIDIYGMAAIRYRV